MTRFEGARAAHGARSEAWRAALGDAAAQLRPGQDKSLSARDVDAIRSSLRSVLGDAPVTSARELRADALPYRRARLSPRAPVTEPSIEAAYQRADDVQPDPEDFASSAAAPLDVEILRQAEDLGYDYVRIYEFVRHRIETEVYAGSMKGALGTLRSGRGNDVDQASLLIALLRASQAAARYVHGVLELDLEAAGQPWGLGEADADAILAAYARAGVARDPVIRGGRVAAVRLEHTWVEAHLPYTNYRGAVVDFTGRTWIPLAPSLKAYGGRTAPGVLGAMHGAGSFTVQGFLDGALSTARTGTPLEELRGQVQTHLDVAGGGAYADQLASRAVVPLELGILPSSLPAQVVAVVGEGPALPSELIHTLRVRAYASADASSPRVFEHTLPVSRAAGSRLTVTYQPATVEDQRTVLFFGGLGSVPAYLVQLRPVLKADGRTVAVGEAVDMARLHRLELTFSGPAGEATVERLELAGNLTALAVGAPTLWPVAVAEDDLGNTEQLAAALLSSIARGYGLRWDGDEAELADLAGVGLARPWPSVAIAANALVVEELGGVPARFNWQGVTLDAALRVGEAVGNSATSLPDAERGWLRLAALQGSALEHVIFEDEFLVQSISADKGLGLARDAGQTILSVTGPDLGPILPQLEHPPEVVAALGRWVGEGRRLEVPQRPLTLNAWTGSVWRVEDLETGAAAYVLTGELNGGATTEDPDDWILDFLADALSGPFSAQPNPDPLAGDRVEILPESNRQSGTVGEVLAEDLTVRVTDAAGRPVEGAIVNFVNIAGGGALITFEEDPITGIPVEVRSESELQIRTNALGLAGVRLELGLRTSNNETFTFREPGDEYETAASVHLVDAWIDSSQGVLSIPRYIEALAFPGEPNYVAPLDGFGQVFQTFLADTMVDELHVGVFDEHGNPISNEVVTFEMTGEFDADGDCSDREHETGAVVDLDTCPVDNPRLMDCGETSVDSVSNRDGAVAGVITGTGAGIAYLVEASVAGIEPYLRAYALTDGLFSCIPQPTHRVTLGTVFTSPQGNNLSAAGLGENYPPPISAEYLEWNYNEGNGGFWEPFEAENVTSDMTGGGTVSPMAQVDANNWRGFATVGSDPLLNVITVETTAGGNPLDGGMAVYALEPRILETVPSPLELSNDNLSVTDLTIFYDVRPLDYVALTREILIYQGDQIIDVIEINKKEGAGFVGSTKGAFYDRETLYELQLVVNRGTEVEARSERFRLELDQQIINRADVSISVSKEVDLPNGLQCEVPDLYEFSLNRPATVDLELRRVEGMNPDGTSELGAPFSLVTNRPYGEGDHNVEIFTDDVPPGDYRLTLTVRDGEQVETREGVALSQFTSRDALPVGQSLIHGVNPWNGGLSLSRTDMAVPGRGAYLNFSRTYSSNGGKTANALGPGWSHSYESKIIVTPCGEAIVIGGEGSGMRFVDDGAGGLKPLRGYNGSLVGNSEDNSFDFYTLAGMRYHYQFAGKSEWLLREISDTNGNITTLDYGPSATGVHLLAVTDSSGRQLAFRYDNRTFPLYRGDVLVEVAGPDGLRVFFDYDDDGNLASARREESAVAEAYGYELVPGLDHELRSILNLVTNQLSGAEMRYTYSSTEIGLEGADYAGTLVIGVQHPEGGVTLFDYDEESLASRASSAITAVTDRVGETMVLSFDDYGSPTSIEDALSHRSTMTWDLTSVKMTARTDARGVQTSFRYDPHGNVIQEDVAGYRKSRTYADPGRFDPPYLKNRVETSTDRNGHETTFEYDFSGNMTREVIVVDDPEGTGQVVEQVYTYAPNGDRLTATDARGQTTHFVYDDYGNLIRQTDPQGHTVEKDYDLRGRLLAQRDANGHETTFGYDTLGRLLATGYPNGDSQSIAYDDVAQTRTETDPNGGVTHVEYDLEGRVTKITNAEGGMTDYTYDLEGRKTRESTWYDDETPRFEFIYELDEVGRTVRRVEPLGRETLYVLDEVGNTLSETLRGGGIEPRVTTTEYDDLYRPLTVSRRLDDRVVTTTFTWDGEGNKLTETDALDRTTTFTYDGLNRLIRTEAPEGFLSERFYDENGNAVKEVTANTPGEQVRTLVYDASDRLSEKFDATGARATFQYDPAGNLIHEVDPNGNSLLRGYDERNRLISRTEVTAAGDITTTYRYDANSNLTGETWPNGNVLTHTYDGLNRLTRSVDSLGAISEYGYDARSNRVRQQDARGHDTFMTYDGLDRLRMVQAPESRTLTLAYDLAGNLQTVTDAQGRETELRYDTLDRLIQVTDPAPFSFTSHFAYDDVGNVVARTSKRGFTTSFEYDELDRLILLTDPEVDGTATTSTRRYDIVGNLLHETDRRGLVTEFVYDAENRRIESRRDGIRLETLEYDANGNVITTSDANDNVTTLVYDERNQLTERRAPLGATTRFEYDPMGNRSRVTDAEGRTVAYTHDLRRRIDTEARNAGSEVSTFAYDGNGNRTELTRPEGGVWRWEFDPANRLTAVIDPETGRTEYRYSTTDALESMLDAESRTTSFEYDELDRLERKIYPGGVFEEYGFDANDNLTSLRDGKGQLFAYDYDAKDRQIARNYPADPSVADALEAITFAYDENNNLLQAIEQLSQSGLQTTTKTYDTFDRLQSVTDRWDHVLRYAYDPNGNRTQLIDPDGQVTTYAYDALNRMESVATAAGVTTYDYLRNGLLSEIAYPNGTSATYTHDDANRVRMIVNRHQAAEVSSFEYSYDLNGNRTRQVENQFGLGFETTTYTYDLADRLLSVTYPEKITTYSYDGVGNRRTEVDTSPIDASVIGSKTYTYDERDQLTQVLDDLEPSKTAVYGYDANGNQISRQIGADPATDFVFDVRDQLVRVEEDASPVGAYRYDYKGLRIQKNVGAGESRYVYDQQSVLVRYGPASNSKYEYGPDRLLSVNDSTEGRAFYLFDALGSVTNLIGEAGTQLAQYRWDAWGNPRAQTVNPANPFGFTGHEMDEESGLIYMKARFYDPVTARFLSHDPLEGDPTNPPSLHRYLYAFQNPTVYTDPTGLMPEEVEENEGIFSGLRRVIKDTLGSDKNRETAERVEEEVGKGAGIVAGLFLGAASFVADAADSALAAAETIHEVVAAGLGDVDAAERLNNKIETVSSVIETIAENPEAVGAAIVDGIVETAKGVARGDAGAITDASSALFGTLTGGGALKAVGAGKAAASAARGAGRAASKAVQATSRAAGKATKAAARTVVDASRATVRTAKRAGKAAKAGAAKASRAIASGVKTIARKVRGKRCFVAGTLVWMASGQLVAIEEVRVGDEVISRNPITGELSVNRVAQLFITEDREILEVEVESAD
ncbi:MAG: RHS repeat-associated core domain-containing protein, partial [Acidobacteriota bacterium]